MMDFALICLLAVFTGIATGLFPAMPTYIGPMLLMLVAPDLPLSHLLAFWLITVIGSQFFGSVAAILTQIPGEDSSLVYLKDIGGFTVKERATLLYETAMGSVFASLLAMSLLCAAVLALPDNWLLAFSGIKFQLVFYTIALLSFCFLNRSLTMTIFLVAVGLFLSPKGNYALPTFWIQTQSIFESTTFFMLVCGLCLIPELLRDQPAGTGDVVKAVRRRANQAWLYLRSACLGMVAGLIPGPSAFLGAALSYKVTKNRYAKVVAAETANNASVITSAIPLLVLGLPINQNTMFFSGLMEVRGIDLLGEIAGVMPMVAAAFAVCVLIYFLLSTRIIGVYVTAVTRYSKWVLAATVVMILGMALADFSFTNMSALTYTGAMVAFAAVGVLLKAIDVNPLPLLFAYTLGDKIIWLVLQTYLSA